MKTQLDNEIALIHHKDIRRLTRATLDACPSCFWTMPASTTGKHHPSTSLGKSGLIRHTRTVVHLTLHLLEMRGSHHLSREHSIAIAAAILHDCCKKNDTENHTAFLHPIRAASLIRTTARTLWPDSPPPPPPTAGELLDPDIAYTTPIAAASAIASCVETHMGRWNHTTHTSETLPIPATPLQRLLHTADFLASRKDITLAGIS